MKKMVYHANHALFLALVYWKPTFIACLFSADSKDREGTQQDWLSNPSFRPEDAAAIHLKSLRKQEE